METRERDHRVLPLAGRCFWLLGRYAVLLARYATVVALDGLLRLVRL